MSQGILEAQSQSFTLCSWANKFPLVISFPCFSGITVERFWRRNSHGYIHTSYEPTNDNELCLAKGQIVQDIVRVDDKEGWYEVKIGQTEMLSSALCIYLHPRGLEIPIISSHTATNRSMSDQHKLIQPKSEIWRHIDKGKNPSVQAS